MGQDDSLSGKKEKENEGEREERELKAAVSPQGLGVIEEQTGGTHGFVGVLCSGRAAVVVGVRGQSWGKMKDTPQADSHTGSTSQSNHPEEKALLLLFSPSLCIAPSPRWDPLGEVSALYSLLWATRKQGEEI